MKILKRVKEWWCKQIEIFGLPLFSVMAIISIMAVFLSFVVVPYFIARDMQEYNVKPKCLAAGYSEVQHSKEGWYCIGLKDGNTVTILVSELPE